MIEILCSFCLCYATAVSSGGVCHSCVTDVQQNDLGRAAMKLSDPNEMLTAVCYEKGQTPIVNFKNKMGPFQPK